FEPQAGKANLYARLKGDGSARPLILLNHMDVVLASPEYWTVAPFSGVVQDGYVWGRRALDRTGEAITPRTTLPMLKPPGEPAHGTPGHGSRPTPDNPVHRLVRALSRIAAYQTPLVVTPAVERYFHDLSTIETDPGRRAALGDVRAALRDTAAVRFLTGDLTYN